MNETLNKMNALAVALRTAKRHIKVSDASDFAVQNIEVAIQLANELRNEQLEAEVLTYRCEMGQDRP